MPFKTGLSVLLSFRSMILTRNLKYVSSVRCSLVFHRTKYSILTDRFIELGGTLGDIESAPFVEALRQLRRRAGKNNFLQIHVSLVPVIHGELKTKPTQAAIRDARSSGLAPDIVSLCNQSKNSEGHY